MKRKTEDQIWLYLHNELSADQKAEFELSLKQDPDLLAKLEDRQATHALLGTLQQTHADTDDIESSLLDEWEEEHPQYAEPHNPGKRNIIYFILPLAAAAAAVMLLTALPSGSDSVRWQKTSYGNPLELRGNGEITAVYTKSELKTVGDKLQEAIDNQLALSTNKSFQQTLGIYFQELAGGALILEIASNPESETAQLILSSNYTNLEKLNSDIPAIADQVRAKLLNPVQP